MTGPDRFFRFGLELEAADELEAACEDAVRRGFPHGVSAVSETERIDASVASREDLELYFTIEKTGRRRVHYTIVLLHPVTDDDADRFNAAFGRIEDSDRGRD